MNVVVVSQDTLGRLYPARQLDEAERRRIAGLVHALACRDGLSIRGAQAVLAESYGIRRSIGAVHKILRRYRCQLPGCPAGRDG